MYKAPLTATVFKDFQQTYQQLKTKNTDSTSAFVYVDREGVKLLTNLIEEECGNEGVFALSMAHNGWVEMLTLFGQ